MASSSAEPAGVQPPGSAESTLSIRVKTLAPAVHELTVPINVRSLSSVHLPA